MILKFGRSGIVITIFFRYNIFLLFSRRESNLQRARREEKEAMAKQVKVSLNFEIEEVCLSIFHRSDLLMGLNILKVYNRRKITRATFECVESKTGLLGLVSLRSVNCLENSTNQFQNLNQPRLVTHVLPRFKHFTCFN